MFVLYKKNVHNRSNEIDRLIFVLVGDRGEMYNNNNEK